MDTFLAVRWDGPNQLLGWMELMFGFKPKVQSNNIATGGTSAKESMIPATPRALVDFLNLELKAPSFFPFKSKS